MAHDLQSIGACRVAGMGLAPVDYSHVREWANAVGEALSPWRFEALVAMSRAYTAERNMNEGQPYGPAPWASDGFKRSASRAFGDMLSGMAKKGRKK